MAMAVSNIDASAVMNNAWQEVFLSYGKLLTMHMLKLGYLRLYAYFYMKPNYE